MHLDFNPAKYGDIVAGLLDPPRTMALGPGTPNAAARPLLEALAAGPGFAGQRVKDARMAAACRAGLWLYHDYLGESHAISQDIDTPSGSYWHAILHRREPDFWNSKYWFRQVKEHPVYERLQAAAAALSQPSDTKAARAISARSQWNAAAFVDLCEAVHGGQTEDESLCLAIQSCEWALLFDYCFEHAVA